MIVSQLIFFTSFLLGCQIDEDTISDSVKSELAQQYGGFINPDLAELETNHQSEESCKLQFDSEIVNISVLDLKQNDKIIFEDDKSIEILSSAFISAVKVNGIVNIAAPEIRINVVLENKNEQNFYLWIGQQGEKSTIMKTDDTLRVYTIPEAMTDKLNDLISYYRIINSSNDIKLLDDKYD
ncbi:MAG TPA: hypothetical protein GXZ58_04285 [Bacilli bacterium]|nr:hypothetical protein [Bacilli bacterium]